MTTVTTSNDNSDNEGDNDDGSLYSQNDLGVQLGFSIDIHTDSSSANTDNHEYPIAHQSPIWSDWDGGQIGGRPSWLQPRDLPDGSMTCQKCQHAMNFLCQLYAPADAITDNPSAFHRSLYVFGCPSCCNSDNSFVRSGKDADTAVTKVHSAVTEGTIRVLRGQLAQANPFYPPNCSSSYHNDDNEEEVAVATRNLLLQRHWNQHKSNQYNVELCVVCGQRGKGACPIQKVNFCGKRCQKEYKTHVFDKKNNETNGNDDDDDETKTTPPKPVFLPSVYAKSELVVEPEPDEPSGDNCNDTDMSDTNADQTLTQKQADLLKEAQSHAMYSHIEGDTADIDESLDQEGLNEATGAMNGTNDPTTLEFYVRLGRPNNAREQVLRYCQWPATTPATTTTEDNDDNGSSGAPLWIRSDYIPETIPSCQYCGAARKFEFQIMPQMLHYLLADHHSQPPESINNTVPEEAKQAVLAASAIIDQAAEQQEGNNNGKDGCSSSTGGGPELPNGFQEKHDQALEQIQKQLLHSNIKGEIDWGSIAVYTCTASCGGGEPLPTNNDNKDEDGGPNEQLGAYREEYAWRQPPLG